MSAPIFISYSSKDQDIAETIYQALEARRLDCWIACRDVQPGENFQEAIVKALRSSKVMLLVFTSNANNSDEIKKELVLAGRHHVTVVPVRVEDVVPNDAFSYEFATRQWIDLFKNWEEEIELLASRLSHVLQTAESQGGAGAEAPAAARAPRRVVRRPLNPPLVWGAALFAVVILIGGGVFYLRQTAQTPQTTSPPPSQIAAPTPPASPAPLQQTAASTPPPAPVPAPAPQITVQAPTLVSPPPTVSEDTAWQDALSARTLAALDGFLKTYGNGSHVQDAKLQMVNLIVAEPAPSKNFDGTWQTIWTCANVGQSQGYTYEFRGQIKDGTYHALYGIKGQPGSLELEGKIEADGMAGFKGTVIVNSPLSGMGAARGTVSPVYALARFDHASGAGSRVNLRPCTLTFVKQ